MKSNAMAHTAEKKYWRTEASATRWSMAARWRRAGSRLCLTAMSALVLALAGQTANAAQLALAQSPLYLTLNAKSNMMLVIDDSGSMGSEVLLSTNDGAAWWNTGDQSFAGRDQTDTLVGGNTLNFNQVGTSSSTWKKYVTLFPNGYGNGKDDLRTYADSTNDHYAIPPLPRYAWARSPAYNKNYFDPSKTYLPWANYGSTTFSDASTTAARSDPVLVDTTYASGFTFDLTTTNDSGTNAAKIGACTSGTNTLFNLENGMVIPSGTTYCAAGGSWATASSDISISSSNRGLYNISYFPATFYLAQGASLPTGYGYTGTPLVGYAPDGTTQLDGYEIKPGNFATTAQYNAAIQNFANWFTYARKRHLAMRGGVGWSFSGVGSLRVGTFTINNLPSTTNSVPMYDLSVSSQVNSFYSNLYSKTVGNGGTPNRQAVNRAGQLFMLTSATNGAPIQYSCQNNFTVLVTDGYANVDTSSGVGNTDGGSTFSTWGSGSAPYSDSYSNTLADIAMYYYGTNLRTDLTSGQVLPNGSDQNKDPHMVTFGIGLGVSGTIFGQTLSGVTFDSVQDAVNNPSLITWPDVNASSATRSPVQVDDLYHGCLNSRGELYTAADTLAIQSKFKSLLQNVLSRTSSAAAVAVNSRSLNTSTTIYQAKFVSEPQWSGDLLAYAVDANGNVSSTPTWSAKDQLISQNWNTGRQIITRNGTIGIPFQWTTSGTTALSSTEQTVLNTDPASNTADGEGQARLNYLRGDSSNEGTGNNYRVRTGGFKLGDIDHSTPIYVGSPFTMPDMETTPHSTFQTTYATRAPMVYVGANDGMVHAFDANTGQEKLAYVPSMIFTDSSTGLGKLNQLTNPAYQHTYFVDAAPTAGDAYGTFGNVSGQCTSGCWRTVLAGGLGAGGKGIYALDVTDPAGSAISSLSFGEGNAASLALWEFTDSTTPNDMGYVYGQPSITKMHNGQWAVIFGNGYNSANEDPILYIVSATDGTLIQKINLAGSSYGTGNGLSTPAVVDVDGDYIADYIYAGDLQGNMWKIDVTGNSPSSWGSSFTKSGNPAPLFQARDSSSNVQPITERPEIGDQPTGQGGLMVYFGTGRYITTSDNTPASSPIQSFYGVWDPMPSSGSVSGSATAYVSRTRLLQQTIGYGTVNSANDVRTVTNGTIANWGGSSTACGNNSGYCMGWYVDLLTATTSPVNTKGEMSVSNPVLLGGTVPRIIFTTLIPDSTPCNYGGTSWLMELSPTNGGPPNQAVFDLNGDGVVNGSDLTSGGATPIGLNPNIGIMPDPVIIRDPGSSGQSGKDLKIVSGSSGAVQSMKNYVPGGSSGRQSWRQLR